MRTPVQGARLTSKFGVRKHPILGYSKMHRGVDFAAKRGTPIMAAGMVEFPSQEEMDLLGDLLKSNILIILKRDMLICTNLQRVLKKEE